MKTPTAGELRHYCEFVSRQDITAANAALAAQYSAPEPDYAKIEPVGAQIYHGTKQTENAITHRFYVRYRADITGDHEIECEGIRYRVQRVSHLSGLQRWTVIEAEELGTI